MSEAGQKLIARVRSLAEAKPDHIDSDAGNGCAYVRDGQPSCIIGRALWDLGLIDVAFSKAGPCHADSMATRRNSDTINNVVRALGLELDGEEVDWLMAVQDRQDQGDSWMEAVEYADWEVANDE